jgi:hypothetical protein
MLAGLSRGTAVADEPDPDDERRLPGARLVGGDILDGPLVGPHLVLQGEAGEARIPVADILAIERPEESRSLAVVLRSGARLAGEPVGGRIAVHAVGRDWSLPAHRLAGWRARPPASATAGVSATGAATATATATGARSATSAGSSARPVEKAQSPEGDADAGEAVP